MKSKIHIVMRNDLVILPAMESLITVLLEKGVQVHFLGKCSDIERKSYFARLGVVFEDVIYTPQDKIYKTLLEQIRYRRLLKQYLSVNMNNDTDIIWFEYSDMAYIVYDIFKNYDYLIHFYEFQNLKYSWKFQLMYHRYSMVDFVKTAKAVIHCEYNRAHITRGLCALKSLPFVLPNKPYPDDIDFSNTPSEVFDLVDSLKRKIVDKKVILYQGIFAPNERRLDEFCDAIEQMTNEYLLIAMGHGGKYFEDLKKKYASVKIIFIPFIKSPYHLLVTQLAHVGVLSYFPLNGSYAGVLNPLYCAPNKIFEYSKFGIPMLSNDLPGLRSMYLEYGCGVIVHYPITPNSIVNALLRIFNNYENYSKGAHHFYSSVDFKGIVSEILNSL